MKLLILGGTRFVGRHLVTAALARGHEVTIFNRGQHAAMVQTGVEAIRGDRNSDLTKLKGRRWDAVIDTSGYVPRAVRAAAETLSDAVDVYVFVSSQSVYADISHPGVDETAPLTTLTSEQLERANEIDSSGQPSALTYAEMYPGLKALCEQAVEDVLPNRVLIIRPGLIVGSYDYSDRFTYWVQRVARASEGEEVLAPGQPGRYVQFIDVRDLAEWTVRMIQRKETGVYNANGLRSHTTMENVLEGCKAVGDSDASVTWVADDFLLREKMAPWSEVPLWIPEDDAHAKGFMFINCDKAIAAGLRFRALNDTVQDTLTWYQRDRGRHPLIAGIDPEKELELLHKWHETR